MPELSLTILLLATGGVIALGTALAFAISGRHPLLGPLRSFAIAAVLATAVFQLLPESVSEVGAGALAVFAGSLVVPSLLGGLGRRLTRRKLEGHTRWAIELGYAALLAHQLAEGLMLGSFAGTGHHGHSHTNLVGAILAHTLPLTIVVVGSFVTAGSVGTRGFWRAPLSRAAGLLAATAAGLVGASWISETTVGAFEPWIAAALAGFVCHVVVHEDHGSGRESWGIRTLDVAAIGTGLALPWLFSDAGHGGADALRDRMLHSLADLTLETAPMLMIGLAIGAGLQLLGARIPDGWLRSGSASRQALRGMAVGAPLPIRACGVLPVAKGLKHRGAGPALVVAFLLATPELGPETFTLTVRFLGWPFAVARIVAALIVAFVAGIVVARAIDRNAEEDDDAGAPLPDAGAGPLWIRFWSHFDELLHHVGPWTVVGLVAAAFLEASLPNGSLAALAEGGMDVFVVSLIAMPSYVCAASATPLAAVLIAKGLSPGAVLVGLLLGPATNVATFGTLRSTYGTRATLWFVATVVVASWVMAFGANAIGLPADASAAALADHEHGLFAWASGVALALAIASQFWRIGVVRWLETLEPDAHSHAHGHAHGHAHTHGHAHAH